MECHSGYKTTHLVYLQEKSCRTRYTVKYRTGKRDEGKMEQQTKQPIWKTILGIVLVIIVYIVGQVIAMIPVMSGGTFGAVLGVLILLLTVGVMLYLCKLFKLSLGEKTSFKWWYILLVVACLVLNMVKNPLLIALFGGDGSTANGDTLEAMSGTLSPIFFLGMTVLFAPIAEEILFRGIGIHVLFKKYPIVGYLVSSAVFSMIHMPTDLFSFFNYFTIGLMFGGVYLLTKDIRWSIAAHVLNNGFFMIMVLLMMQG